MRTEQIPLLKADPDLAALLAEPRRAEAERRLLVSTHRLGVGPWDVSRLSGASADHIGLLVLEGVLARELIVADHVSALGFTLLHDMRARSESPALSPLLFSYQSSEHCATSATKGCSTSAAGEE